MTNDKVHKLDKDIGIMASELKNLTKSVSDLSDLLRAHITHQESKDKDLLEHIAQEYAKKWVEEEIKLAETKFASKWVETVMRGLIGLILTGVFVAILALVLK